VKFLSVFVALVEVLAAFLSWLKTRKARAEGASQASKDILDDIKARADLAADAERGVTADNELPDDPLRRE
jgi:hypothetical protein